MTQQSTEFFDGIGGGTGAPGALLKNVNDYARGEIVDMYQRDYVPVGKTEPEKREDGVTNKQQLVIILQTEFRNWQNVNKVPVVNREDPNSPTKDPSEDDGKRAIYVPEGKNIQFAIGRAVGAASQAAGTKVPFAVGGNLGVKIFNLKPTTKGNPLKEHEAIYTPPSAGSNFLASAPAAPAQQTAAPVAAAPAPVATPAPAAPVAAPAPVAQDPWASAPAPAAPAGDPWASAPATEPPPF